jgi:hypothetical protein
MLNHRAWRMSGIRYGTACNSTIDIGWPLRAEVIEGEKAK